MQHLVMFCLFLPQKPANILVMGEGPERGRVKIGKVNLKKHHLNCWTDLKLTQGTCVSTKVDQLGCWRVWLSDSYNV